MNRKELTSQKETTQDDFPSIVLLGNQYKYLKDLSKNGQRQPMKDYLVSGFKKNGNFRQLVDVGFVTVSDFVQEFSGMGTEEDEIQLPIVRITDLGKLYVKFEESKREEQINIKKKESIRYWVTTGIALGAVAISIIALFV
jgi:hypothetical protein